ncbi:glycosyltransferase family 2 protein [uncultured Fibrobacter sp.]|uniref:glycosyltransferase family 2 protein n=1 Tax=uncultured Fibrobacter sp. TaxID=261512 RepID=UPI0025CF7071|nr:glycosyltransferase family 2 protein [uncultured Fibrobacter sp.]
MNNSILTIIVTYNGMKWIDKCIHSVFSSSIKSDIFVVDNASSDNTPDYIATNFPQVHLVKSKKNLGFGAANNIGLQHAIDNGYDYVYLLNQDAWVKEDTFEKLISAQKNHPEYGILSPLQLESNESHFDFEFGKELSEWNNNSKVCEDLFFNQKKEVVQFPMIMAAHWLISRDCLIDVGGFSPAFYHYGEDNNYADRVRAKGYKIGVSMSSKAIHNREGRPYSEEKELFHEFCVKIVELSNFTNTSKSILWNYTYEILLKIIFSRKNIFCRLKYYIKFVLNIPKYNRIKKASLNKCAFLKINNEK